MVSKFILLILISLLGCTCLMCFGQGKFPAPSVDTVVLTGKVMDKSGAIAPGIQLSFRNTSATAQVVADSEGRFNVTLRQNIYELELFRGKTKMLYKRSKIDLSDVSQLTMNIVLLPQCVSLGCERLGYDFTTLPGGWLKGPPLDLVIAYNEKKDSGGAKKFSDAILTYGRYTIAADLINVEGNQLLATNGWIEDGYIRRSFTKLNLSLTEGPLFITQTWMQSKESGP